MECNNNIKLLPQTQQQSLLQIIQDLNLHQYTINILSDHEKGNNFMGEIVKIKISGISANDQRVNKDLVLKAATSIENVRKIVPITVFYKSEMYYYTKILPVLKNLQDKYIQESGKFNFVNCYKVHSKELEEFLILDDVTAGGFTLEPRKEPLSLQHLELALKNIAYYHSLSFALRKHSSELFQQFANFINIGQDYLNSVDYYVKITLRQAITHSKDERNKKYLKTLNDDVEKLSQCLNPSLCEPYNVLSHGDCWQNNIMFKCENGKPTDAIFLDWQIGKYCSPHVDLLHLLFSASDAKLRKTHYHHLIDLYYNTLKAQLTKLGCDAEEIYPEHIYKEHIKLLAPYGITFSIISANLLIREGEDIPDIDILMKDGIIPDDSALAYKNNDTIEEFSKRVDCIVNDFRTFGLI